MAEGTKILAGTRGIGSLNSRGIPSLLGDNQLSAAENMIFIKDGGVEIRQGSVEFKSNAQWADDAVIGGVGYKLGTTSSAEIAFILESGKIYYSTIANISANPTTTFNSTATFSAITGFGGNNPLIVNNKNQVFHQVLNNRVFFCDGTNQLKYFGADHVLTAVPDPITFEITMTVSSSVAVSDGDTYEDGADASRTFEISVSKTGGTGTTIILRQTSGNTRPAATGTLSKTSGSGDSSVSWTAVAYSDNYIALGLRAGRLVAITDTGYQYISEPNNGADFAGTQSEQLAYGLEDGLTVTNISPFKRGLILSLTESTLEKAATGILTGYRKYDSNTPDRTDGLFKVDRESNMIAIFGRSGQEIGNGFIGLTKKGFVTFSAFQSNQEFGITDSDFISEDIRNLINRISWSGADGIRSAVDENNQRYWCAVPTSNSSGNSLVLVYDFGNSRFADRNAPSEHKWSIFTFNFGSRTIESLFTIFGHPFIGLSDGTVVMGEVDGVYADLGQNYASSISSKHFDFGSRLKTKKFDRGIVDLLNEEQVVLSLIAVTNDRAQVQDWGGKKKSSRKFTPIKNGAEDTWTLEPSDVWSLNPLDVWGSFTATRQTIVFTSAPKFVDFGLIIRNGVGGARWGVYGYEFRAHEDADYYDGRFKENVSKVLSSPLVGVLIPLVSELSLILTAACYSIV